MSFRNLTSFIEAFVELIDRECPIKSFAGKGRYLGKHVLTIMVVCIYLTLYV